MHRYFIKTPALVKKIFNGYIWDLHHEENAVYLTFDDGPHPDITPWVLEELKKFNAYGTFFSIGKNVEAFRETYNSILEMGHATGNHTFNHLNGWKTEHEKYIKDILMASRLIHSNLFRPPYGKINIKQARSLKNAFDKKMNIVMWDVLSADFDKDCNGQQCIENVIENVREGSIVVFHDSEKAFPNLKQALPVVLDFLSNKGYKLMKINQEGV
jgi:peptidoglycan/xylan/chitin deacetylase (PgdA/CDA1 family)